MAPLNCCSFRRTVSPEPRPAVLIDISQTGERFALSSHTPSRAGSREDAPKAQPIQDILVSATKNGVAHELSTASGNNMILAQETTSRVRRRSSSRRHHDVASKVHVPTNTAVALSRMLVQRGSDLARKSEESEKQALNSKVENGRREIIKQKYSFNDEDSPRRAPNTRSISLLDRSNTVLHMPSPTKPLGINVANPEFLNTPGVPSSPDLPPISRTRTRDAAAGGDPQLSFAGARQSAPSSEGNEILRSTLGAVRFPGVYDTRIRPASEQLLHGTSGLWGHSVYSKHSNSHSTTNTNTSSSNGHSCSPECEEMSFGGTDGKIYSPPTAEQQPRSLTRPRSRSEGSDPVHLYNMHIPRRLASRSLLCSVSLPQLKHPRRDRSYTSGSSSRMFSVKPPKQPSSSMPTGGKHFQSQATHFTSSSVYSSGSPPSSSPESSPHINSRSDNLYYFEAVQPIEEIIDVPTTGLKSVDVDNPERRTVETSYHSSNESLMNRELAAAETRISPLPRANTVPKNSQFRVDLDQISAELALTNPPRRRISNLDGAGSAIDEDAKSIWERALREHSLEDKAISHTRIGSTNPDSLGPTELDPTTAASNVRRRASKSTFECIHPSSAQRKCLQTAHSAR